MTEWVFSDQIHTRQWSKDIVVQEMFNRILIHYGSKIEGGLDFLHKK